MRVCIQKSTSKLIESQSYATEGTMIKNALQYGYLENDLEEREVIQEEYRAILDAQPKPDMPKTQLEILQDRFDNLESKYNTLQGVLVSKGTLTETDLVAEVIKGRIQQNNFTKVDKL